MTRESRAAWWFLAPSLTVIAVFFVLPVMGGLALSLTDFDIYALSDPASARLTWFDNYARLLADPVFWKALRNTLYFALLGGPLSVAASLAAALLLSSRAVWLKGLFRTVFFAPVVTTLVAVAVVWRSLYHPRFGLANQVLGWFGLGGIDWLGDPAWAMPAIIIMAIWKNFGYNMVIFMAGLGAIPESLYEAARIDGAGVWRQFRSITLPMLRPTTLFVSLITMIGYLQLFAEPYVMTRGGPLNATLSVALLMYEQGFRWWNMGFAAAVAFVLFALILAGTLLQLRLQKDRS
ncbi:MAG TPA: sugar ABC transporter permease [Thermoanaerobaculaceae bacterium]|nr:sugar ABC transporter permease [Thermoanaerobaculaceae bacterium]HRS15213.1 sugar ABC transporter permease [Thermoanaerobaculaceae bacterium]